MALTAPLSTCRVPSGSRLYLIQCLRADIFSFAGRTSVPMCSPSRTRLIRLGVLPLAIIMGIPDIRTLVAASILEAMPPRPTDDEEPPAWQQISGVISSITSMRQAFEFIRGSQSINPSMSVSVSRRSADASTATSADRLSLSPSLISSTTTVSFSLIMGVTPHERSVIRVFLALR